MNVAEKLQTIAENAPKVFEAGKKSQYDEFWDDFQMNGNRRDYNWAFYSRWRLGGWSNKTFQPKYPIICDGGANANADTMACRAMCYGMYNFDGEIKQAIILRNTNVFSTFEDFPYLKAIHDLTLENITYAYRPFTNNIDLETLNIKGEIAVNGFSWQWSTKLNKESIQKIIGILSTTTSGLTITLSKTAVNNAFTDAEWATLIATKPNWTISLV